MSVLHCSVNVFVSPLNEYRQSDWMYAEHFVNAQAVLVTTIVVDPAK